MARLVLFNTGWMRHYRGLTSTDRLVNGGQYVRDNADGWEVWNFLPVGQNVLAYVRTTKGGPLDLERIGAAAGAPHLDDVTVVFTATRPEGGRVVVGWYRNARLWRTHQTGGVGRGEWQYLARTRASYATLLEPDQRVFPVARARAGEFGMGQANVRYLDKPEAASFVQQLTAYLDDPMGFVPSASDRTGKRSVGRSNDPVLRGKVELAAIEHVWKHYSALGYRCASVEKDNVGWDLEVTRGGVTLLVEVKGCAGDMPVVELTPNEYKQMRGSRRASYRLAVVTNALASTGSTLAILAFNPVDDGWWTEDGRRARSSEIVAARFALESVPR